MTNTATPRTETSPMAPDEIDLLLGSMEIEDAEGAEIEEVVENEIEELEVGAADPDELRALEMDLTKSEVYEETKSETPVVSTEAAEKPAAEKKAKKPAAPKAPKIERDLNALPASAFQRDTDLDADGEKKFLLDNRPRQKKIAEKFDTTISALHAGRKPSVYVMECFKVLDAKKEVTATDLVAALKASGYTDGTARSQVGQIMVLFDLLGIADRIKNFLVIKEGVFAEKLRKLV